MLSVMYCNLETSRENVMEAISGRACGEKDNSVRVSCVTTQRDRGNSKISDHGLM